MTREEPGPVQWMVVPSDLAHNLCSWQRKCFLAICLRIWQACVAQAVNKVDFEEIVIDYIWVSKSRSSASRGIALSRGAAHTHVKHVRSRTWSSHSHTQILTGRYEISGYHV